MRFNPDALALLDQQAGIVGRWQLRDLGYGRSQIDAMLRRGHLSPVLSGVYVRTGSGWSPQQEALAAVVRCGPSARLTGERVLGLLGVEGVAPSAPFTVLLATDRRLRGLPFRTARDHQPARDRAQVAGIPSTTPSRAVIEVAGTDVDDEQVLGLLDRGRWRSLLTVRRVRSTAAAMPGHRGATRVLKLLGEGLGEQESPGERRFADVMADVDPPLEWQVHVAPDLRVDALWRDAALVVEYQGGATHEDPRDREADAARHERLRALGYEVVVVDRHDLRHPAALRARLLAARDRRLRTLTHP